MPRCFASMRETKAASQIWDASEISVAGSPPSPPLCCPFVVICKIRRPRSKKKSSLVQPTERPDLGPDLLYECSPPRFIRKNLCKKAAVCAPKMQEMVTVVEVSHRKADVYNAGARAMMRKRSKVQRQVQSKWFRSHCVTSCITQQLEMKNCSVQGPVKTL